MTTTTSRQGDYAPLGDYAFLGDGHGAALGALDGHIDWLAVPEVDSPPFLGAVLDAQDGGYLVVSPTDPFSAERRYVPGTMVLETDFHTSGGVLRVTDALTEGFQGRLPWSELARSIEVLNGQVRVRWELRPGTRFATVRPWVHQRNGTPFILSGDLLAALVLENLSEVIVEHGAVRGEALLGTGQRALVALVLARDKPLRLPSPADVRKRIDHTIGEWKQWSNLIRYSGPHATEAIRSALVIKALASADSGALAAAPTTSLPEVTGGSRNYDYRYAWVRDASFMIDALGRLGLSEEVDASIAWLLKAVQRTAPDVHVFYTLAGQPASGEQTDIDLMEGYKGSEPVTVGNKAATQTQHGSYGDLLGAIRHYVEDGGRLDTESGLTLAKLTDRLCDEWTHPDAGLWELGDYHRYTSSLINSWNALDCACRLAERGEMPTVHLARWKEERELVHGFADQHCWSEAKQSYTFYAGTDDLDASTLLAARCGFLAPDDPRLSSTIDAIRRELTAEGPWLYRYTGAAKEENAFVACTFWMIEALAIASRTEEAAALLEAALGGANDLGLWSEEVDPFNRRLKGNFPIGISHLAVIGAITSLRARQSDHD